VRNSTYKVIWGAGSSYAVEVTAPDGTGRVVAPFKREAEAQSWIAEEKWKDALAASQGNPAPPQKPG